MHLLCLAAIGGASAARTVKEHDERSEAVSTREGHGGGWKQDVTYLLAPDRSCLWSISSIRTHHWTSIYVSDVGALDSVPSVSSNHIMCLPLVPCARRGRGVRIGGVGKAQRRSWIEMVHCFGNNSVHSHHYTLLHSSGPPPPTGLAITRVSFRNRHILFWTKTKHKPQQYHNY